MASKVRKGLVGLVAGATLAFGSCSSNKYSTNTMEDFEGPRVTQEKSPYEIHEFTDNDGVAYRASKEERWFDVLESKVKAYGITHRDHSVDVIDNASRSVAVESDNWYPLVEVDLQERKDEKGEVVTKGGKPVFEYVLAPKGSVEREIVGLRDIRVKGPRRAPGFGFGVLDHNLTEYNLPTVNVGKDNFYIVKLSTPSAGVKSSLPLGFLNTSTTKIRKNYGTGFLELEGRVLRPIFGTLSLPPVPKPVVVKEEKPEVVKEEVPKIPVAESSRRVFL